MWRAALQAGIEPDQFWHLSLREWRWLCQAPSHALSRDEFKRLSHHYPDNQYTEI